ncbi:FAD-dependent oxidoreductase [Paracoccus sp. S-4012]|uniref:FAD-dependent oxidoreductase n=1 Tax=Paracoccus sp. S-4012 TaxID=2665648 RepID=UPI0018A220D9|nr:FAD-dependent oxidoreductase [Paracoccus sp. S-4012]
MKTPAGSIATARGEAPLLSDAHDTDARAAPSPAEAEYRANVRPPDWVNPDQAERYDLVILGGGPAGIAAARLAVELGARVALVERGALGGDSLNSGCIPSQTLAAAARQMFRLRQAAAFGINSQPDPDAYYARATGRVRQAQATISRRNAARELSRLGIEVHFGDGRFTGADRIVVGDRELSFQQALIATGGRQRPLGIGGTEGADYLLVDRILDLKTLPGRLMVVGGGSRGTQIAQTYCRLGADVTLVQDAPYFMPEEEREAAQVLSAALASDGVRIRLDTAATAIRRDGDARIVTLQSGGRSSEVVVDRVLAAVGRMADVTGLDPAAAGIVVGEDSSLEVDDFLCTANPRVHAAGDVCMARRHTQVAEASARLAVLNALTGARRRISDVVLPWCTHTDPEIAHVGLYITEAFARDLPLATYTVLMHQVDRAVTAGERVGFAKIHTQLGTDRILGATIVARDAGDIISEVTLAMQRRAGLRSLAAALTTFPSRSQTVQLAAQACVDCLRRAEGAGAAHPAQV